MFMMSIRLPRKRLLMGAAALVLVVGIGVTGINAVTRGAGASATLTGEGSEKVKAKKVSAKTEEERMAYIESFGWEAVAEPAEVLEVIIPQEFDAVYQEYNGIQKKQGFDLESYAGKRVKRYSYVITNYPGEVGEVRLSLLVYKDKVIGGDVSSMSADGFMHGFAPEA